MDKKEIDNKIKSLKKEIELLEVERGTSSIKPSQTKELIKKWYGHCFSFEGYESGSLDIMLDTIRIDRKSETISIGGHMIIYVTPDISFLDLLNKELYPVGGTLICDGIIDINTIPYVEIDWEDDVYTELNNLLEHHELPVKTFKNYLDKADKCCDNSDYVRPLEEICKNYEKGYTYEYDSVFGQL